MENINKGKDMDLVRWIILVDRYTKDIGLMVKNMVQVAIKVQKKKLKDFGKKAN